MAMIQGPGAPAAAPSGTAFGTRSFAPAAPAPRPPAAPSGASYYQALQARDPIYRAQLAGVNAAGTANQGNLDAARTSALAQYGAVPSNAQLGFNPTAQARDLANQATLGGVSTVAQAQRAYGQANAGDAAAAASRGLAHSGLVGQYTNENLGNYQRQQYADLNALLSGLGANQQSYLGQQQTLQGQANTLADQAYARINAGIKAGVYQAPTATAALPAPLVRGRVA